MTIVPLWSQGVDEGRVLEDRDVVPQSDELRGRTEARPAEEAVVRGHDDREDDEGEEDDKGGSDEDQDLESSAPIRGGAASRRRRRRRCDGASTCGESRIGLRGKFGLAD